MKCQKLFVLPYITYHYNYLQQLCREIIKFLISRKSYCTQFYLLLENHVNDDKKAAIFKWKIRENI